MIFCIEKSQSFRVYDFQDIKNFEGRKGCKISYFIIFRISRLRGLQRLQNLRLDHFQDTKVVRIGNVAKAGELHTLSFSGYQGCEYCKGWKVSDFIIFRTPGLLGLQKVQNLKLYHFQDIKVGRVAKVAKGGDFQALSFSGY